MTLTPSFIGPNPQQPSIQSQVFVPDQLIVDAKNIVTQPIIVGAGKLARGTVLGQQAVNPITAAPGGSNVGNGTISGLNVGANSIPGVYTVVATDANDFTVTAPGGIAAGTATVGAQFFGGGISFLLTEGATPFEANDAFNVTVTNAVGIYLECVKTASDGTQNPLAILADFADASAGPVRTGAYVAGEFNVNALIADPSWTMPPLVAALRLVGIFAKPVITAAQPANNSAP